MCVRGRVSVFGVPPSMVGDRDGVGLVIVVATQGLRGSQNVEEMVGRNLVRTQASPVDAHIALVTVSLSSSRCVLCAFALACRIFCCGELPAAAALWAVPDFVDASAPDIRNQEKEHSETNVGGMHPLARCNPVLVRTQTVFLGASRSPLAGPRIGKGSAYSGHLHRLWYRSWCQGRETTPPHTSCRELGFRHLCSRARH